jgi:shikimate dehydrogenase
VIPAISAATRLVALLGDPVAHSLSPAMQNAAFAALELDAVYLAIRCDEADIRGLLRGIARSGGAGNVTVPHKEAAARALDQATVAVQQTGACNTFWFEDGAVHGDNTDVAGVSAAIRSLLGGSVRGGRVLLLGAGGSARGAIYALLEGGVDRIVVLNRSADRARSLQSVFPDAPLELRSDPASLAGDSFDLAINATSLGLRPEDPLPLALDANPRLGAVLDLVYGKVEAPWVTSCKARGIPAADGREVLLWQGAAAFTRWWGREAPVEVMRRVLGELTVNR